MNKTNGSYTAALTALLIATFAGSSKAQDGTITVNVNRPGIKISPNLYGLMTEEINHSYDGGLYAELIRNRIFRNNRTTPVHWRAEGSATISLNPNHPLSTALTTCLKVETNSASKSTPAGISNSGYWGIPVKPDTTYHVSYYAMAKEAFSGKITVSI